MWRLTSIAAVLAITVVIHVDFHLARPATHHWSFGLWWHWVSCMVVFGAAGAYIARRWPAERWRATATNLVAGLIGGQVIEPLLENIPFGGGIAWHVSPERWNAFFLCAAAGIATMVAVVALMPGRRIST